jgi:predicted RNA-binding Zn ribbon-like protein
MRETHHAPGRIEFVREFVNTRDIEEGTDELEDAEAASAWLRSKDLSDDAEALSEKDRRRLVAVREALRALLLANNAGEPPPAEALDVLNEGSATASLSLRFEPEGAELVSAGGGANAALAELLAIVHSSMRDGTWERLKACPAEDCHWAFYDRSRNRSATWCQMGACGNRSKARAFRARRRRPARG